MTEETLLNVETKPKNKKKPGLKALWKKFSIFFQTSRSKALIFIGVGLLLVVALSEIAFDIYLDSGINKEINIAQTMSYDQFLKKLKDNDFDSTRTYNLSSFMVEPHKEWIYYDKVGNSWRASFKLNEVENGKMPEDVQPSINRLKILPDKHTNWMDVVGNLRMMFMMTSFGILILAMQFIIQQVVAGKNFTSSSRNIKVTFNDIVGYSEVKKEFMEFKNYTESKKLYKDNKITLARGILLTGDPGVGKTLFAKALANELNYAFYSMSGSDFVELYAGVGARRVRALFAQARMTAPSLIFIDEIDALGSRSQTNMDSERLSTLNQLLAEMDGMSERHDVLVVGATNADSRLDSALKRPGRFDKKITIPLPDNDTRRQLLEFYLKDHAFSDEINIDQLANHLPRATGADIRNLVESAKLGAFRRDGKDGIITNIDLDTAMEELAVGLVKQPNTLPEERKRIGYHELGHALMISQKKPSQTIRKISMVGRNGMLGFTWSAEINEKKLYLQEELLSDLVVMMGGRAAESVFMGNVSSGAADDLERATILARRMVCEWGMSRLGLVSQKLASDTLIPKIYLDEIHAILQNAYEEAISINHAHKAGMEIAQIELQRTNEMTGEEFLRHLALAPREIPSMAYETKSITAEV